MKASNPTERPTQLRATCGCRFTPQSLVPAADEGILELTHICFPHSIEREKRLQDEETRERPKSDEGPCERVFAGYGVAGIGYKCAAHGCGWPAEGECPSAGRLRYG